MICHLGRVSGVLRTALCAIAPVVGWSASAAADEWSLHAQGEAQAGWTDNILSAAEDPPEGEPEPTADLYYQLTPGFLFAYNAPRHIHEAEYEVAANLFQENSEANSISHNVLWVARWLVSPRSEVETGAALRLGNIAQFNLVRGADAGNVDAQPGGDATFVSLEATEGYRAQLTRRLRFLQSFRANRITTSRDVGDTEVSVSGSAANVEVGLEQAWEETSAGVRVGGGIIQLGRGPEIDPERQLTGTAGLTLRRDLGRDWAIAADGGVIALRALGDLAAEASGTVIGPTYGAALGYGPEWGNAGISVRRTITPNLFIAETVQSDIALLNVGLPLPWLAESRTEPVLAIAGSVGVAQSRTIDVETDTTSAAFETYLADAAFSYRPRTTLAFTVRYQYQEQIVDPTIMQDTFFDFSRHTVLFGMTIRYPSRTAAEGRLRTERTVQRTDTDLIGEQVDGRR